MPPTLRAHLFTDMAGYGHLLEDRGEQEALMHLRTYERIVRRATASRSIDLQKAGDRFHLVFRLPADAVRSAIDIAEALARHNQRSPSKVHVRFGVDAGQSVHRAGQYVGPAPVVAAHLCSRGRPGQILVSEGVRNLIRAARIPMRDIGVWRSPAGITLRLFEARPPDGVQDEAGPGGRGRFLAALFFTDIVRSTATAAARGDQQWRDVVEQHHAIVREELERHRGTEIDTAGDGFYGPRSMPPLARSAALSP